MTVADDSSILQDGHSSGGVDEGDRLFKEWRCGAPGMPRGGALGGMGLAVGGLLRRRRHGTLEASCGDVWRRRKDGRRHSHNRTNFDYESRPERSTHYPRTRTRQRGTRLRLSKHA